MENLNIEIMKITDLDGVYEVEKNSFENHWSKKSLEDDLKNEVSIYLVAKIYDKVVGYMGAWKIIDEAHITNIAVLKECRGKKIGEALLKEMINTCKDNKINSMTLEVRVSNLVAQNLYKKFGFKFSGIRKEYYSDNKEDAIIMWNDLKVV